jgi:DNA topoisomerase I
VVRLADTWDVMPPEEGLPCPCAAGTGIPSVHCASMHGTLDKLPAQSSDSIDEGVIVDPADAAEAAGLNYVSDQEPGIRRRKAGKGFTFVLPDGGKVTDAATLQRIRSLAIPPAYQDVWICTDPEGHIQATGRDARGRKQYRYHPRWREVRDSTKYEHMLDFAKALPALRKRLDADMAKPGLHRDKVLATVVNLLENTLIRVGNDEYAKQNKSYGLTTLRNRHVAVQGSELKFAFKGKSGKTWNLRLKDRRVAKVVRACQELPGQHLFQYVDEDGQRQVVTSADVNAYLREATGSAITAKDFRTWAGTLLAAVALREMEEIDSGARTKKNVKAAIERVAARLGNTPTICRKCYVHPEIVSAYLDGGLGAPVMQELEDQVRAEVAEDLSGLRPEEALLLALLHKRLSQAQQQAGSRAA